MAQQPTGINPPKVLSLEQAVVGMLAGSAKKRAAAGPIVDDPMNPTPAATAIGRKKHVSISDMEKEAERLASEPDGEFPLGDPRNNRRAAAEALVGTASVTQVDVPTREPEYIKMDATPIVPRGVSEVDLLATCGLRLNQAKAFGQFINRRARLTIELKEAELTVPVVNVYRSKYSILVVLPLKANEAACVPKPGTEVTLTMAGGFSEKAYYPGAYTELPELELAVMTFIRQEQADAGKA